MDLVRRERCVYSGKEDLRHMYTFKQFPIFMGCTDASADKDVFEDMAWWISESTGSIQLNPLIALDTLYDQPHNDAFGGIWEEHHSLLAELVAKFSGKSVLEIGGANGILAKNSQKLKSDLRWTLLEPNPRIPEKSNIQVIKGFLTDDFSHKGDWDCVVHSHFLEHAYDPRKTLNQIHKILPTGGKHIFSMPNMRALLEKCYSNCLNFEHTLFLHEQSVEWLLANAGFKILERKHFYGHSIMFVTEKVAKPKEALRMPELFKTNSELFKKFIDYNLKVAESFNAKIKNETAPIYLFGAHVFSQCLIGFGLDTSKIVGVLDNSPAKIGRRLYGTNFIVESPSVLANQKNVKVILKAANYSLEIKSNIVKDHNQSVEFWE